MCKSPAEHRDVAHTKIRTTLELDGDLLHAFKAVASAHERTFAAHLRLLMKREIARAAQQEDPPDWKTRKVQEAPPGWKTWKFEP